MSIEFFTKDEQPTMAAFNERIQGAKDEINNMISTKGWRNPNLLHNWYFADLICQRKIPYYAIFPGTVYYADEALETEAGTTGGYAGATYVNTTYGTITIDGTTYYVAYSDMKGRFNSTSNNIVHSIDRWAFGKATQLFLMDGCLRVRRYSTSGSTAFVQYVENPERLAGRTLTFSVLIKSTDPDNAAARLAMGGTGNVTVSGGGLHSLTGVVGDSVTSFNINVVPVNHGDAIDIVAVKLELGDKQTLARQDEEGNWVLNDIPDKGLELLKCQRYFQRFRTEELRPAKAEDFRPVMRTTPVLSSFTDYDGVTYYTASADL